jgi:hypothetical protein
MSGSAGRSLASFHNMLKQHTAVTRAPGNRRKQQVPKSSAAAGDNVRDLLEADLKSAQPALGADRQGPCALVYRRHRGPTRQ